MQIAAFWMNFLGAVASVGGAVIAFFQARRASNAAREARRARDQLIGHRNIAELAQLQASCKKALRSIEKYGPAANKTSLIGCEHARDAADVQEFLTVLRENRDYFGKWEQNVADEFLEVVEPTLDRFAKTENSKEWMRHGRVLVHHLSTISGKIKQRLNNSRETLR